MGESTGRKSYHELLRHPLWQQKRLEIFQERGFKCEDCGGRNETLNVHHGGYIKGRAPWEYPDDYFQVLCDPCHKRAHVAKTILQTHLSRMGVSSIPRVIGYVAAINTIHGDGDELLPSLADCEQLQAWLEIEQGVDDANREVLECLKARLGWREADGGR